MKKYLKYNGMCFQDLYGYRDFHHKLITDEQIALATEITQKEYRQERNLYFKKYKEHWVFEGATYRNLDNFEFSGNIFKAKCTNYDISSAINSNEAILYHNGSVWNAKCFARGWTMFGKAYLTKAGGKSKITSLKNCAPIINVKTKEILSNIKPIYK